MAAPLRLFVRVGCVTAWCMIILLPLVKATSETTTLTSTTVETTTAVETTTVAGTVTATPTFTAAITFTGIESSDFNSTMQTIFLDTLSTLIGVGSSNLSIVSFSDVTVRRRLLATGLNVNLGVTTSSSSASSVATALITVASNGTLSSSLQTSGFPAVTITATVSIPIGEIPYRLAGRTLRATALLTDLPIIAPSNDGGDLSRVSHYEGIVPSLFQDLEKDAGVTFDLNHSVSTASLQNHSSRWTACVQDVADGKLDVCFGDFWETSERRQLSSFMSPMYTDTFMLLVKGEVGDPDVWKQVFFPFTWNLWICIAAIVFLHALVQMWFEQMPKPQPRPAKKYPKNRWLLLLRRFGNHLYDTTLGFLGGAPSHDASTWASRILLTGYGFFILVVISSYTANLASILLLTSRKVPVANLDSAVDKGMTVCTHTIARPTLQALYPKAKLLDFLEIRDAFKSVIDGKCVGVVESIHNLNSMFGEGLFCTFVTVGGPLFQMMVTQPVAQDVGVTLSYWMSLYRANRLPDEHRTKFQFDRCGGQRDTDSDVTDLPKMTSVLIVFAFAAGIALVVWVVDFFLKKRHYAQRQAARQQEKQKNTPKATTTPAQAAAASLGEALQSSRLILSSDLALVDDDLATITKLVGQSSATASARRKYWEENAEAVANVGVVEAGRTPGSAFVALNPPEADLAPPQPVREDESFGQMIINRVKRLFS